VDEIEGIKKLRSAQKRKRGFPTLLVSEIGSYWGEREKNFVGISGDTGTNTQRQGEKDGAPLGGQYHDGLLTVWEGERV